MKSLAGSLFVCACALVLAVEGFPNFSRLKRETTSEAASTTSASDSSLPSSSAAESSSSSTAAEPTSTSTSTPSSENNNKNDFGFGAAAGIGGLRHSIGVGNFDAETKADNFSPWGAFAGINLGNGGRIGAGCSGLNCGVQLGHFVLGTPHLLGIGRNILRQENDSGPEGKKSTDELTERSEVNLNGAASDPDNLRLVFRDAFRGFHQRLQSFFRAPVTHFIKKHVHIDNSTESVVGAVKPAASEQQTYRIQLTPAKPAIVLTEDKDEKQNQQENEVE